MWSVHEVKTHTAALSCLCLPPLKEEVQDRAPAQLLFSIIILLFVSDWWEQRARKSVLVWSCLQSTKKKSSANRENSGFCNCLCTKLCLSFCLCFRKLISIPVLVILNQPLHRIFFQTQSTQDKSFSRHPRLHFFLTVIFFSVCCCDISFAGFPQAFALVTYCSRRARWNIIRLGFYYRGAE